MAEVEESNDAFRLRKLRLNRSIRKMRLERAYLLENLGKRMKKNGDTADGRTGIYDEDSEGSSDGPPTPREKPLRSKRSHRRHVASPVPNVDNAADSSFMHENPKFQAYKPSKSNQYSQTSTTGGPHSPNGQPADASFQASSFPASSPNNPGTHHKLHPLVPPIPPADAFSMYLESRYLSQAHKYPQASNERELVALAQENWDTETDETRQRYLDQEAQQRQQYQTDKRQFEQYEAKKQRQSERDGADQSVDDADKMEEDADEAAGDGTADDDAVATPSSSKKAGATGGFTSINA